MGCQPCCAVRFGCCPLPVSPLCPCTRGNVRFSSSSDFRDSVGGYRHKERRDRLLDILDVDVNWHMHEVSDGERRRVQIVSGLMAPWDVLLLDEVFPFLCTARQAFFLLIDTRMHIIFLGNCRS